MSRSSNGSSLRWSNWAGNQHATPSRIARPTSEAELVNLVKTAALNSQRVKAVGAGHSFTAIAVADEILIDLTGYRRVLHVDAQRKQVTVEAGITLSELNQRLDEVGLAMANLGDIAYQSIAGAISTSTHGTGAKLTGLAAMVVGVRLIDGSGDVQVIEADGENAAMLPFAQVGLGALGLLSTVTIQCVDAFDLHVVNEARRVDDVVRELDDLVDGNDHFEFFWMPHTTWALTKRNNRTDRARAPRPKVAAWINDYALENYAFGGIVQLGRRVPSLIPKLANLAGVSGRTEFVDRSFDVFASPRLVRFVEMEQAIPRSALPDALREVMAMVERDGHRVSFPVEVRFTAADRAALSTAHNRESAYIAVHMAKGTPHERYFDAVDTILRRYDARPHWGKVHSRTAADLAPTYARFEEFVALRDRLDPQRRFANPYLDRVLGA